MIADKIFPSFYVLDLDDAAANLEFMLGKNFGIKRIRIGSADFSNDLNASAAGQTALNFFLDNSNLDLAGVSKEVKMNPEFFPSLPKLQLSVEQQRRSDENIELAQALAGENKLVTVMTNNFDNLGDFITSKVDLNSTNFSASLRIAVNPTLYMKAKSKELELSRSGSHRDHQTVNIH